MSGRFVFFLQKHEEENHGRDGIRRETGKMICLSDKMIRQPRGEISEDDSVWSLIQHVRKLAIAVYLGDDFI